MDHVAESFNMTCYCSTRGPNLIKVFIFTFLKMTSVLHFVLYTLHVIGFGGLEVACWPLVPKFAGSNPAEAVRFLRAKNPQRAFLRRGSKAVCPMSQICGM